MNNSYFRDDDYPNLQFLSKDHLPDFQSFDFLLHALFIIALRSGILGQLQGYCCCTRINAGILVQLPYENVQNHVIVHN